MRTSPNGINLIKHFEGFRSKPYQCSAGKWTIGYGSTYYPQGIAVTKDDTPITEEVAAKMLSIVLASFEHQLESTLVQYGQKLNQNEFDACICFIYNLGAALLEDHRSFGKALKSGNRSDIAAAFLLYIKAGGKILEGLQKRREAERQLFLKEI